MSIQWRPEQNSLTTPHSYWARIVPKDSLGYAELAERIVLKNPVCSAEQAESVLRTRDEEIMAILLDGSQVSLENSFTYHLSVTAKLDAPDDPLPPDYVINVQVYAARPFAEAVRQAAKLERLPPEQKVPLIAGAEDTVLGLNDVLNPGGVLRLTGTDLLFDPKSGGECVIEGSREGRTVQTRFAMISNSLILVVPEIPSQPDLWNNEYRVAVSTRYTAHGSLRTGAYQRLLRTPLAVSLTGGSGILSGAETSPLARVTGGQFNGAAASARVRIQAAINAQDGKLRLSLLDMSEGGAAGDAVRVTHDSVVTLSGYADSALASLEVTVDDFKALVKKVREEYTGRMVDILDVSSAG